jgi:uncharacterized linocin/CFP29 family protein
MSMQKLRRVGLETGQLTDEEMRFIDGEIIEAAHPVLHAREIFETKVLPNAGLRTLRHYTQTDMGQAIITMDGENISLDRTQLTAGDVKIPVISKDFSINWRDILAARHNNQPLDIVEGRNAARQVAEEENKLLFTGEYTGWPALGIEGLATATGRNTEASAGAWPANALTDINDAIAELEADGFTSGPYVLLGRVEWIRRLNQGISSTEITYKSFLLNNGIIDGVIADDNIYTSAGLTTSALVVQPGRDNFELAVGQDLTTWEYQLQNMNKLFRVFEVLAPHVKRPESICEITGLT